MHDVEQRHVKAFHPSWPRICVINTHDNVSDFTTESGETWRSGFMGSRMAFPYRPPHIALSTPKGLSLMISPTCRVHDLKRPWTTKASKTFNRKKH